MASAGRQKRSRAGGDAAGESSVPDEPIFDGLENRHDLARGGVLLPRAETAHFEGCSELTDSTVGYLLTQKEQLSSFLPAAVKRESSATPLLPEWEAVKLLPPAWYRVVFELKATPGRYRAVAESKLLLDGYPAASRSPTDADREAGFVSQKELRLLLYPNALRFFHLGLHEVLRAEGAWPPARQVMMRGYELGQDVREALRARMAYVGDAAPSWLIEVRATLHERHWPRAPSGTQAVVATDPVKDSLRALPLAQLATTVADVLEAVTPDIVPSPAALNLRVDPRWLCRLDEAVASFTQRIFAAQRPTSSMMHYVKQHSASGSILTERLTIAVQVSWTTCCCTALGRTHTTLIRPLRSRAQEMPTSVLTSHASCRRG